MRPVRHRIPARKRSLAANLETGGDVDLGPERALVLPETVIDRLRELADEFPDEDLDLYGVLDAGSSNEK